MSVDLRSADKSVVAVFLGIPVPAVQEQLNAMSPKLYGYMQELFDKFVEGSVFDG